MAPLIGCRVKINVIREHWAGILRPISSLQAGAVLLSAMLDHLPMQANTFHIRDVALMDDARKAEFGVEVVDCVIRQAEVAGLASVSLVAVGGSLPP